MNTVKVSYTINSGPTYIAKVNRKAPIEIDDGAGHFASTCLKPCLQAILLSRPELLENAADYSICCLDQQETDAVRTRRDEAKRLGNPFSPVKVTGDKVWEGKGMLSWVMQENDASITDPEADGSTACGKLSGSTLHVTLSFTQVRRSNICIHVLLNICTAKHHLAEFIPRPAQSALTCKQHIHCYQSTDQCSRPLSCAPLFASFLERTRSFKGLSYIQSPRATTCI